MTLITRLSTAFTDTSLPVLRKDPVLPSDSLDAGGDRVLYDFKNPGSYTNQTAQMAGNTITSLAYPSVSSTQDPAHDISYDSASGRATIISGNLKLETAETNIFTDPTASYAITFWGRFNSTPPGFENIMTKAAGGTTRSIFARTQNGTTAIDFYLPAPGAGADPGDRTRFDAVPLNTVTQFGVHWTKASGVWQIRNVLNNGTPTAYSNLSVGNAANGINIPSGDGQEWIWRMETTLMSFYRVYVENLTVSGRTAEQVWAADWARGNGRYS